MTSTVTYIDQYISEVVFENEFIYLSIKKIFIATPGDLIPERAALLDVVTEVNTIKAHHSGFHLEVLGWEDTLPGNGRPQSLINEEIKKCDLFIMILWEHWGTPSGQFSSGTEEEFYVAQDLYQRTGKPECWLFFKNTNRPTLQIEQFKIEREEKRDIYYHRFDTTTEWTNLLRTFLCKWIDLNESSIYKSNKLIDNPKEHVPNILYRISYQDWIGSGLVIPPIIYFTIEDEDSFLNWKQLNHPEKKQFIYDRLSENLGLILGANPYLAQLRYKHTESQYILLATISRKYEDSLDTSRIFIPNDYSQLCSISDNEVPFEGYF